MEMPNHHDQSGMYETTFGVDGEIETYTSEKPVSTIPVFKCLKSNSDLLIILYIN